MYSDKFLSPLADTLLARHGIDFSRRQKELHRQPRFGAKVIDRNADDDVGLAYLEGFGWPFNSSQLLNAKTQEQGKAPAPSFLTGQHSSKA